MSSWESIPNNKKESIVKSLYRFDRVQSRKRKFSEKKHQERNFFTTKTKNDLRYLHLSFRFGMEELKNMLINLVLDNILEGVQQLLGGLPSKGHRRSPNDFNA